jgi:hypothetical protein
MQVIQLTPPEQLLAATVGSRRRVHSIQRGHSHRHGADPKLQWDININGALGELAAAKALNVYWPASVNAPKNEPDLPPYWQVRTAERPGSRLIVREDDADDQRFVLVVGVCPDYTVVGWILGGDAKRDEWIEDLGGRGHPCWAVPQSALEPV